MGNILTAIESIVKYSFLNVVENLEEGVHNRAN